MNNLLITRGFSKPVPTDMDWHGSYKGWYVTVTISKQLNNVLVVVTGTDDTHVMKAFDTWEEALILYNNLTYIQSSDDLSIFVGSENNNGWPTSRFAWDDIFCSPPKEEWTERPNSPLYPW